MSLYSVEHLKQNLKSPSYSSKYKITVNIPTLLIPQLLIDGIRYNSEKISILANSANLPSMRLSTSEIYCKGNKFVVRGATEFDNMWKVTFYNDTDMYAHTVFSKWMYACDQYDNLLTKSLFPLNYGGANIKGGTYNAGYMSDAEMIVLKPDGSVGRKYLIHYLFPIDVSDVQFDANDSNKISTTTVTFAYTNYKMSEGLLQELL